VDIYRLMQEFLYCRCAIFTIRYTICKRNLLLLCTDVGIRSYPIAKQEVGDKSFDNKPYRAGRLVTIEYVVNYIWAGDKPG
jgi:hypothetical protein